MIVFLHGILAEKQPNRVVVDVSGVGYEAGISAQTFGKLPETGSEIRIRTYHHMTESEQRLFGFLDTAEQLLFELLITVKGIGPRLALTILSGMNAQDLTATISRGDTAMLARTPGIGKKTAERVVLELRDKMQLSVDTGSATGHAFTPALTGPLSEAVSALEALGFKSTEAQKAAEAARKEHPDADTGELVRVALQRLYK